MPIYEWKRWVDPETPGVWEYTDTTTMDPPPGPGWQRSYSFGLKGVQGAGESPPRQVSGR